MLISTWLFASCSEAQHYELIIQNGKILRAQKSCPTLETLPINADTIAAIGGLSNTMANTLIDAEGMVIDPGFINIPS